MNKHGFVHIHSHTEMSMLDGGARIKDIITKVHGMGQTALATTDHGNMHVSVKAHKIAHQVGIKHIVGCELYTAPWGRKAQDKKFAKGERSGYHLVALAKTHEGYQNLCKLSSLGYTEGFYRRPRVDMDMIEQFKGDIIITSACVGGAIPQAILAGDLELAEQQVDWFASRFGEDFYLELQNHGIADEKLVNTYLRDIAQRKGIPLSVGIDAHYLNKEDGPTHDALICIGTGQTVDGERRYKFQGEGYYYMSEQEVVDLFPTDLEAIKNTGIIANKVDDQVIKFGEIALPYFDVQSDEEFEAWKKRGVINTWNLQSRNSI